MSALIPSVLSRLPDHVGFCDVSTGTQNAGLRFKIYKQEKEPQSNWNHTVSQHHRLFQQNRTRDDAVQCSHFGDSETEAQEGMTCGLMNHARKGDALYRVFSPQRAKPAVLHLLLLLFQVGTVYKHFKNRRFRMAAP